jgi:hypothetical protein
MTIHWKKIFWTVALYSAVILFIKMIADFTLITLIGLVYLILFGLLFFLLWGLTSLLWRS